MEEGSMMWNRNVSIDHTHSRAICDEIGERLRTSLERDLRELPLRMQRQIDQLRELDEQKSPSIVPTQYTISRRNEATARRRAD
jgi:hypothetical protein